MMSPTFAWKLVLTVVLAGGILISTRASAPRRTTPGADLRCLVFSALLLYAVGLGASLSHHGVLAAGLYATGIVASALAVWLSRGSDSGLSDGNEPADEQPPPDPDGAPRFDWDAFERQFRIYDRRRDRPRAPVG